MLIPAVSVNPLHIGIFRNECKKFFLLGITFAISSIFSDDVGLVGIGVYNCKIRLIFESFAEIYVLH